LISLDGTGYGLLKHKDYKWHSRGQRFDPAYLHQQKGFKSLRFEAFFVFFPLLRSIFHAKSERNEFSVLPLLYMARISA